MRRFSPTLIGVFVLGALALAVFGVVMFGARAWWSDREYFVVYFTESVHGLSTGSAVKLMGVPIGRVAAIHVSHRTGGDAVVQVVCEIDRDPLIPGAAGGESDLREPGALEQMVEDGLQARLNILGITGMLYLELGFFEKPADSTFAVETSEYVVVPSTPSVFDGLTDQLAAIAVEVGEIDFAALTTSATRLMDTASAAIEEARLEELFVELHAAVDGLNALMDSGELEETIMAAGKSFQDLSQLAAKLESEIDPLSASLVMTADELRETLREIARTFDGIQEMVGPRLGIGRQVTETLNTINEAARSVERLADFLERNPEAIVRGRGESN